MMAVISFTALARAYGDIPVARAMPTTEPKPGY
jgi:pyrroline-5-carboxylate reductase